MALTLQVTFDAGDPGALAAFWAQVLGYMADPPPEGFASWEDWAREQGIPEDRWNDASAIVDPDGAGSGRRRAVGATPRRSRATHRGGRDQALRA